MAKGRFALTRTDIEVVEDDGVTRTLSHEVYRHGKAAAVLLTVDLAHTLYLEPLANLVHHATAPSYLIERREQAIGFCDLRKFGAFVEANQGRNKKITGSLMLTCYLIELRE